MLDRSVLIWNAHSGVIPVRSSRPQYFVDDTSGTSIEQKLDTCQPKRPRIDIAGFDTFRTHAYDAISVVPKRRLIYKSGFRAVMALFALLTSSITGQAAIRKTFLSKEIALEERKTAFMDDRRCANLEDTRPQKDPGGKNCEEAEAH